MVTCQRQKWAQQRCCGGGVLLLLRMAFLSLVLPMGPMRCGLRHWCLSRDGDGVSLGGESVSGP